MASHPYISGPRNVTQMIGFLRKNFPANVTSETVKKLGLAPKNESYVINVLQFIGLIDGQGKRTDNGHAVMTKHDDGEFQLAFAALVKSAYSDLFNLHGDDAWTISRDQLIGYFRNTDKTGDTIGTRQASVFVALRELSGYQAEGPSVTKLRTATAAPKVSTRKAKSSEQNPSKDAPPNKPPMSSRQLKSDMALTVRIEINLPAEGTPETYDAIFKSIKANLFP